MTNTTAVHPDDAGAMVDLLLAALHDIRVEFRKPGPSELCVLKMHAIADRAIRAVELTPQTACWPQPPDPRWSAEGRYGEQDI